MASVLITNKGNGSFCCLSLWLVLQVNTRCHHWLVEDACVSIGKLCYIDLRTSYTRWLKFLLTKIQCNEDENKSG